MKTGIVAFFAGILSLYQLPFLPDARWILLLVPLFVLLIIKPSFRLIIFFIIGFLWSLFRADHILSQQLPEILEGQDLTIQGSVIELPHRTSRRQQFILKVNSVNGDDIEPYRFKLNWYNNSTKENPGEVNVGDQWRLVVRVKRPNGFMNPGGRDYEASLFQQGINASGYVKEGKKLEHRKLSPMQRVHLWRSEIYRDLKTSLPDLNGIIPAMGLGIRDDMTPDDWHVLTSTGTVHLTAISGLHIGLIAALAFFLGRWLWSFPVITLHWLPATKMGAICAMIAAVLYAALAGFSIPTQRALIMVISIMLCLLSNREMSRFDIFTIALLSVLLFSPASVIAPGFWLSFTAVAIIFYTLSGRMKTAGLWQKSFKVHFILVIGLAPFLLLFFGQNPLLGPLANIIAVPFFALLITPMILLGIFTLSIFKPAGEALLKITNSLIDTFWPILEWIANLPHTSLIGNIPSMTAFLISLLGIIILLMPKGLPGRWLAGVFFLPAFLIQMPSPEQGNFEFVLLDVGQGLAVVIRTREHVLLYDTGAKFSADFDTGKAVILPYLKSIGINKLDKVIISHGDNDHIGGFQSLAKEMLITETLSSVPEKLQGDNIHLCKSGQNWTWDGVSFEILHPEPDYAGKGNNRSCVLKIDNGYKSVLLTGDIEATAETVLMKNNQDLDVDLLVAPHHGSKTSSTTDFLSVVSPEYVLFPAGYRNRFHHPAEMVVKRYEESDIKHLNTATDGAIRFNIGKTISTPDRYRQDHGHFWNRDHVNNHVE